MKGWRQPAEKKREVKQVTLMIDSKILQQESSATKSNFEKTLRRPLSSISMNTNLKPRQLILKTPTSATLNLNSTIKRPPHSKSRSEERRSNSIQRSKSLSTISTSPHTKSISFVSKQSNMKCFQKLVFKITDFFEKEKYTSRLNRLSYETILRILHELHYIQYPTQKELVDNGFIQVLKKVYQFWLNLSTKSYATLKNLIYLLCSIENIIVHLDYIESALASFRNHLERRRGTYVDVPEYIPQYRFIGVPPITQWSLEGDLVITKNSSWKIQQSFGVFKTNRLNYCQRSRQEAEVEKFSISERSNKLALNKRQKIESIIRNRQPNIEKITLEDILNFKEDDLSNPPLSARTYDQNRESETKPVRRQRLKLHRKCQPFIEMLSQPKVIKIMSRQQLEYERNKEECTFKPDINPIKTNKPQSFLKIKNVVKTLERMKNTRESKIEEIQFRETGWTSNHRRSKSKSRDTEDQMSCAPLSGRRSSRQSRDIQGRRQQARYKGLEIEKDRVQSTQCLQQQNTPYSKQSTQLQQKQTKQDKDSRQTKQKTQIKIPLLFIDINIDESQKQRLVIYQQDNSIELASIFAKKHNLNKEMEMKLKELLDYQMNSILTKIEEEADEEEDIF